MGRADVTFRSGGADCAAWRYEPEGEATAACVVMANGFSLTRHDGLARYAEVFAGAGAAVIAFDHRYLGDSGGAPRQRFRKADQLEDWRNAVEFARGLDGVDPARIVLWGYSFSGGHAIKTATADERIAATMTICPYVNGLRRAMTVSPRLAAWILPRALADLAGRHNLVAVTGEPGEMAAMSLPGEAAGFAKAVAPGSPWRNEISPGVFATIALHRPGLHTRRIRGPVWVGLGERDITVHGPSVTRFAERAGAELRRYPLDHFEPMLAEHAPAVASDQIEFLRRHGLAR